MWIFTDCSDIFDSESNIVEQNVSLDRVIGIIWLQSGLLISETLHFCHCVGFISYHPMN